jgi:pyruvate,water dikinase
MNTSHRFIRWFADISIDDIPLVGGKNASLGEMFHELSSQGVKVPNGFAVTADGYRHFLSSTDLDARIKQILGGLNTADMDKLQQRGSEVRHAILATAMPKDLQDEMIAAYAKLSGGQTLPLDVAVRSSAKAEDLPDASFAG